MSRGSLFIVFEGIDGSGKTTICKMLENTLKSRGINVFFTSEPTSGEYGKIIREKLRSGMEPLEAVLLFALDRYYHVKTIGELLKTGHVVLCDRYYYSSLAYQGALLGENMIKYIEEIHRPFIIEPDVVFLLDVRPEVGLSRVRSVRENGIEIYEEVRLQESIRKIYLRMAEEKGFIVINAEKPIKEVFSEVLSYVDVILK